MHKLLKAGLLITVLGVAGCASVGQSGSDNERQVRERAAERWNLLIAGKLDDAYAYLSPGTREIQTLDLYKVRIKPGRWKKATVDSVSCQQDRCDVVVLVEYDYKAMKSMETRLEEVWLKDGGKWWFVPKK